MSRRFLKPLTCLGALGLLSACGSSQPSAQPDATKTQEAPASDSASGSSASGSNASGTSAAKQFDQQVWILGFDGVDPGVLDGYLKAGKLPNIQALKDQGTLMPLTSTIPPQSPVAWASFATGLNPGGHGIYDFIKRDPTTYLPAVGSGDVKAPSFGPDGKPSSPVQVTSFRSGTSFWKRASDQGVKSTVLNVPFAFPPDPMAHGRMLSGLGTPDLRGTNSTFTFFSQTLSADDAAKGVAGGKLIALSGESPFTASFDGPWGPDARGTAAVTLTVQGTAVSIALGGKTETVEAGAWSDWFDYSFQVTPQYTVRALGRFFVISASPLEVYMYPPNIHPDAPWLDFTTPSSFAGELKGRVGPYKTVGWTHDTNALNSEKLPDKPWLQDVFDSMDRIALMGLKELDADPSSLFIWVETATDRVGHMLARANDPKSPRYEKGLAASLGGDPMLQTYQRMDDILGKFRAKLTPNTVLLVISDHGFHTYRRGLHTNAWLKEKGYLVLKEGATSGDKSNIFVSVDWSKTKAYALGTGQIYINLAGREGRGTVTQAEYPALVQEISTGLKALQDPKTKEMPVVEAYLKDAVYKGTRIQDAPDIQVAFKEGWRTSWETMLGGIPDSLFADNQKKWSGDHSASDVKDTPGILLSNQKIPASEAHIIDIAPTVLSLFGLPRPDELEGKDLFNGTLTRPAR